MNHGLTNQAWYAAKDYKKGSIKNIFCLSCLFILCTGTFTTWKLPSPPQKKERSTASVLQSTYQRGHRKRKARNCTRRDYNCYEHRGLVAVIFSYLYNIKSFEGPWAFDCHRRQLSVCKICAGACSQFKDIIGKTQSQSACIPDWYDRAYQYILNITPESYHLDMILISHRRELLLGVSEVPFNIQRPFRLKALSIWVGLEKQLFASC